MSKYFQFVLVIIYVFITVTAIFVVFDLFGWLRHSGEDFLLITALLGWLFVCFSAAWYIPDILLLFLHVRKPIREEEVWLKKCLFSLQEKTGTSKRYRLRIQEEMGINAAAIGYNTILVSKGALQEFTAEELTAVMAHELGHLTSRDCVAGMAYLCATCVPRQLSRLLRLLVTYIVGIGIAGGLIGLVIIGLLFAYFHLFHYIIPAIAFVLLISGLEWVFERLWLLNSRYTEYRQDAFAHQLGFGKELRTSLLKIIENKPQKVSFFYTLTSTHPVIYNRIRRLEKLEELRS